MTVSRLMQKLVILAGLVLVSSARSAEWQWAIDTEGKKPGKAFLWIPPECEYVRGIFFGQQVILEQAVFEDPQVRAACAREDFAILFLVPGRIAYDDFGPEGKGAATYIRITQELAEVSGYAEVATAPFLTIGHSGGAIWAWRMGYWKPERCFGVIGLRAAPIGPPKHDPKAELNGVPVLVITGQYETWDPELGSEHHWRWCRGDMLAWRTKWKNFLGSVLVQPGAGHFNWDDKVARYVAMFIEKATQARIPTGPAPAGQQPKLKELRKENGWLTDHILTTRSNFKTAAYADYQGDATMAFWHIDEELARANEAFGQTQGKKLQLVTALNERGGPEANRWMQSVELKPLEDGITFKVRADFVKVTPKVFSFPQEPYAIGHAEGPIRFRPIGSAEQVAPDTFRIRHDRFSLYRGLGLSFMAYHPGDDEYAYTEQPCSIKFPRANKMGKDNAITFEAIPDQKLGVKSIELNATSDSGLPVRFCVLAGPAEVNGNFLSLTKIPPRTEFPVRVSLIAYQWGRSVEPLVQSAEPVERSFLVTE